MPGPLELRSPFWWLRWVPAVVLAVLMPQLLYVAGRVAVVPVLASFALAYLVNPLVERFEARGLSRTVASYFRIGANSPPSSARALAWRAAPTAGSTSLSSQISHLCFGPGPVW